MNCLLYLFHRYNIYFLSDSNKNVIGKETNEEKTILKKKKKKKKQKKKKKKKKKKTEHGDKCLKCLQQGKQMFT